MNHHPFRFLSAILFAASLAGLAAPVFSATAPAWVPDPANSRWIDLGDPVASNGVDQLESTSEGTVQPVVRAGRACCAVVPTPKDKGGGGGRYWYFQVGDWADWTKWLGDDGVMLTLVYYDGKPANIVFGYDSSDPSALLVPSTPGAWRAPAELKDGLVLKGSGQWKTLTVPLPLVLFQKRCNGGDFRFGPVPADSDFALAGVAVTRVPRNDPGPAQPARCVLPVCFAKGEGVVIEGPRVRFPVRFVQEPGQPLVIEAECATSLQTDGRGDLGLDAAASGGAFIHFVTSAEFNFTVTTPGRYQAWERARFPFAGYWSHSEMIGDQTAMVNDSTNGPAGVWTWVKAGLFDLAKGEQRLQLQYMNGAQLDQIVFLPADAPAPTAPLPHSPVVCPARGWAETGDLRPLDVKHWLAFAAQLPPARQSVLLSYSIDGGRRFQPLPESGSLTAVAAQGGGKDRLRFRAEFRPGAGQLPPFLQGAQVSYEPGPHNEVTLANEAASLTFSSQGLVAMKHLATGCAYTRRGGQAPLFALGLKRPGPAPLQDLTTDGGVLASYQLEESRGIKQLALRYRMTNGIGVVARVALDPRGQSRWTLAITNPTALEIAEVEFPILPGVRLGNDPAAETLFFPRCWGQIWKNPVAANLAGGAWGPHLRWMDLWTKTDGLYLGAHDDALNDTCLTPLPDSATSLKLSVRQRIYVAPQSSWRSGNYVVAFHGGDWHEGADIYRAYISHALRKPDPAEWARWADLWDTQHSGDLQFKGWGVLPEDGDRLVTNGVDYLAANRQMMDGMDSGYCGLYPYPAIGWGSTRELTQQLDALRLRGLHYTPYMNWHLWAPGYGHYPRCGITAWNMMPPDAPRRDDAWWAKVAARNYDGSYPKIVTDRYAQIDADIGAPAWRERLEYWTRRYLEWGADGMYYDQFNMNYFSGRRPADYDTYGFWTRATLDTLRRATNEARRTDPYYVSSGEAYLDVFGQALDFFMTSGVVNRLEVYAYCNPHMMFIDGGWNGGLADTFGGWERERFIWQVGGRFEQIIGPETWPQQVLALRRRVKSLLYRATFRDTVGLVITNAQGEPIEPQGLELPAHGSESAPVRGISGRWFLFRDRGERGAIINLINTPLDDTATLSIQTRDFGPVRAAWAFTLDGKLLRLAGEQQGQVYRFLLPKTEMASIVLVNRLGPIVTWDGDRTTTGGETARLRLELTNLDPEPLAAKAWLKPPRGWRASAASVRAIAPGATATVTLPVRVPAAAQTGRYDLHAQVSTRTGRFTAYHLLAVARPVTCEFRGDPGTYRLVITNLTGEPTKGTVTMSAPAPLTATAPPTFDLPAHGTVTVPVTVAGQDRLDKISEMSAKVVTPLATWDVVRGVMPIVPNGDFEQDSAADRRPDWWQCRTVGDAWSPEKIRLEPGAPSGKYCLRVDPSDAPKGYVYANAVDGALKPHTKYRVSAWIKRLDPTGDVSIKFSGFGWASLATNETNKWVHLEFERIASAGGMFIECYNASRQPVWFDAIKVEEVP